jgi:hypothetical protein
VSKGHGRRTAKTRRILILYNKILHLSAEKRAAEAAL